MNTGRKTIKGTSPKRYQGGFGKGGFGKRYMFLFFQKEHTFGEYRTQNTFGGPKNAKRNTLFAKQETALYQSIYAKWITPLHSNVRFEKYF
jgi:hypothetical protein